VTLTASDLDEMSAQEIADLQTALFYQSQIKPAGLGADAERTDPA
jgi:hypothetical protein